MGILLLILIFMFMPGCVRRRPSIQPLGLRQCPAYSFEVEHVNHCLDPPVCSHVEQWDGKLCMGYDPETKRPLGLFWKGTSCNPVLNPDCDDPDENQNNKKKRDDN